MRINPFVDIWKFLTDIYWATPVFWLLLVISVVIAARAWREPGQRTLHNRRAVGHSPDRRGMWWQQSLWKVPPNFDGLHYWTEQMVEHAAFAIHGQIVKDVVLANFVPFAYLVYFTEVAVAISLMLGLFVRAGATVGALLILNLYFGLYRSPAEWPWTYVFLILLMVLFAVGRYGRHLGADAVIAANADRVSPGRRWLLAFT